MNILDKIKNKNEILDVFLSENESIFFNIEKYFRNYKEQPELFGDEIESKLKRGKAFKEFKKAISKTNGTFEVSVEEDFDLSEKLGGTSVLLEIENDDGDFLAVIVNDNEYEYNFNIQVGNKKFYIELIIGENKKSKVENILLNEMLIKSNQQESKYKQLETEEGKHKIRIPALSKMNPNNYIYPEIYDVEIKVDFCNSKIELSKIFTEKVENIYNKNFTLIENFYKKNFKDFISHIKDGNDNILKLLDLMQISGENYAKEINIFNNNVLSKYKNMFQDFDYKFCTQKKGIFSFLRHEPW